MKFPKASGFASVLIVVSLWSVPGLSQDRLKTMPGYDQAKRATEQLNKISRPSDSTITWKEDGSSFEYAWEGIRYRFDIATRKAVEIGKVAEDERARRRRGGPERGRQFDSATSPDAKLKAFHRDRNLWLSGADGKNEYAVTTDGDAKTRIKYGVASWVYGEELYQTTAMWWSPDSRKIAFYRFDESRVPDFFLQMDQTKLYSTPDIEAYPKAGEPNPVADIWIYDTGAGTTVKVDVRDGKPFDDDVVGYYAYSVRWSPDGRELLFNRTNRLQNILELAAADPETGKCRVVVRDEWAPSWVENLPEMRFLKDGRRFLWSSERTGWKNYYLYDLGGKLLATLTRHPFEVAGISHVDEKAGFLYYMARSGDNHMKLQLHRVRLDGKGDKRLTDAALNHVVTTAPTAKVFVDIAQAHDVPPVMRLRDSSGKALADVAASDISKFEEMGFRKAEIFTFKAADGVTTLHGLLSFPLNFDPGKKYPLLVGVYAGPATNGARESFIGPNPMAEYGFLVASFDSRSAGGRGKAFLDAIYKYLGIVEIDDQAAGVRSLWPRPYLDRNKVGIFGTSYGGYASAMCLLRHPEVFAAASAASSVTSWYHYDSIYTERYMGIPRDNKEGYDAGSAMTYAPKLDGRLLIYYGTADNNVHPNNSMQLIQALQKAGKSFEVQVGPDAGHSGVNTDRMMEFFIENLVMNPVRRE